MLRTNDQRRAPSGSRVGRRYEMREPATRIVLWAALGEDVVPAVAQQGEQVVFGWAGEGFRVDGVPGLADAGEHVGEMEVAVE